MAGADTFAKAWAQGSPAELATLAADPNVPGGTALMVCQCLYTKDVENAFALDGNLLAVTKNLTSRLSPLIELLRSGDLDECVRTIMTALVTLLIGQLRQIKDLHQDCWKGCLRYYPTDTSISVKCGETTLEYELSTTNQQVERLVLTDLSFSVYYQAMQAMGPAGNGIVHCEGPPGTGKSETLKDLAKELGMKCTVVNPETHSNSWIVPSDPGMVIYDEFTGSQEQLKELVTKAEASVKAKEITAFVYTFDSTRVAITPLPGAAVIKFTKPDFERIAEVMAAAEGFSNWTTLAVETAKDVTDLKVLRQSFMDMGSAARASGTWS